MKQTKQKAVTFPGIELENAFLKLESGSFNEKELFKRISRAIIKLEENPNAGIKIRKKLWPKEYIQKLHITNLWKYDLSHDWRLIYTIQHEEVRIISVILEWMNHTKYERRFKY